MAKKQKLNRNALKAAQAARMADSGRHTAALTRVNFSHKATGAWLVLTFTTREQKDILINALIDPSTTRDDLTGMSTDHLVLLFDLLHAALGIEETDSIVDALKGATGVDVMVDVVRDGPHTRVTGIHPLVEGDAAA